MRDRLSCLKESESRPALWGERRGANGTLGRVWWDGGGRRGEFPACAGRGNGLEYDGLPRLPSTPLRNRRLLTVPGSASCRVLAEGGPRQGSGTGGEGGAGSRARTMLPGWMHAAHPPGPPRCPFVGNAQGVPSTPRRARRLHQPQVSGPGGLWRGATGPAKTRPRESSDGKDRGACFVSTTLPPTARTPCSKMPPDAPAAPGAVIEMEGGWAWGGMGGSGWPIRRPRVVFKVGTKREGPLLGILAGAGRVPEGGRRCGGCSESGARLCCARASIGCWAGALPRCQGCTVAAGRALATVAPTKLVSDMFQSDGPRLDRRAWESVCDSCNLLPNNAWRASRVRAGPRHQGNECAAAVEHG